MHQVRRHDRMPTSIPVTVSTVLQTSDAVLTDVSEGGAKVSGVFLPQSTRITIDHDGQSFYGTVMWAEIDRVGVKFDRPTGHFVALAHRPVSRIIPIRQGRGVFGRKIAA